MQIKSTVTTLDLTPAEALAMGLDLHALLQGAAPLDGPTPGATNDRPVPPVTADSTPDLMTESEVRRRVLRRLAIPQGQRDLFTALAEAPAGLSLRDLAQRMRRKPAELAGVLGAFGRRINGTPHFARVDNVAPIELFLEWRLPAETGVWLYRLKDDARLELQAEGLIQ